MATTQPAPKLLPLNEFDPVVFNNECVKHDIVLDPSNASTTPIGSHVIKSLEKLGIAATPEGFGTKSRAGIPQPKCPLLDTDTKSVLSTGTYKGTQRALTAAYNGVRSSHEAYFDAAGFEPSLPRTAASLDEAKELYNWTVPGKDDAFPPHLAIIPAKDYWRMTQIFDVLRLGATAPLLQKIIPDRLLDFLYSEPNKGGSLQELTSRNQELRKKNRAGVFAQPNIGDRSDWYSDAVFARQQLSGVSPGTLELASPTWVDGFVKAAEAQGNQEAVRVLDGGDPDHDPADQLYIQDYSWFRSYIGVGPTERLQSDDGSRVTAAPVGIFKLTAKNGILHPIAICIDFKGSFDNSVVLFNQRLRETADKSHEGTDWPWRYAKTVMQSADWHRHEVGVHLTESHFIEEATIVAVNRAFPQTHLIYQLLSPHWYKTLSLNAAARSNLFPKVVVAVGGMKADSLAMLSRNIYKNYDFVGRYVPNDLERRGFPVKQLNDVMFHNCAYARGISLFWSTLRKFVSTVLKDHYKTDDQVRGDDNIAAWCEEMQNPEKGDLKSFPTIKTVEELIDAVTACIHIASPFHSAINYLQNYYYSFVVSKPPALFTAIPTTLNAVQQYKEQDLMHALPVNQPRDWLIASHVPWLLSKQVASEQNIVTWAASVANATATDPNDRIMTDAARALYKDLEEVAKVIQSNSDAMDDQDPPYLVLTPSEVAVSILI